MTQKSLEALPIDIHHNKLLDWLVNRRHCTQQCQAILTLIRDKMAKAKEATIAEDHKDDQIQDLLTIQHLNFFQVKELVELLKSTDSGKKNLIGQYSSQSMKIWAEILKLYEKDGTYLAEAAQMLVRNVNYEVPAVRKQISKCQQTQKECLRKENEYASSAVDLRKQYAAACKKFGIEGNKIKTEFANLVKDLPSELSKFAESAKSLSDAIEFYDNFTQFVTKNEKAGTENVLLLKHILDRGNTTTYEWRTGQVPSHVEDQCIKIDLSDEQDSPVTGENDVIDWLVPDATDTIDFGEAIDFDIGDITIESDGVLAADGEICLENPAIDAIDTRAMSMVSTLNSESASSRPDAAVGKDALSLIDNPETRNFFLNDLLELQLFLTLRSNELSHENNESSHMVSAPSQIHIDIKKVTEMMTKVKDILDKMTSVQMQHLLLIKDSPRYVDRLRDSLRHKLVLADKMGLSEKEMAGTRQEAIEEERALEPQLDVLRRQTKVLKKQLEDEISKKYNDRKVNIIGEINLVCDNNGPK